KRESITGVDQKYYDFVKQALYGVVNEGGTGTKAKLDGYDVCGKTGTVQIVGTERGGNLAQTAKNEFGYHAWFVSFAPLSDPQVALAVLVEHGGHGADAAAPLAQKILEAYFKERNIPPLHPPRAQQVASKLPANSESPR
ncbi:MAG: hypothetical protein C5B54_03660, partial [Acidobacteria bacterium]